MDRRFLTVLGVSLLFALVISSVFYQMTARAGSPKKAAESTDLKDIVVAARPLAVGTTVKPADIKMGKIPSSAFPKGAFRQARRSDRPPADQQHPDGRAGARRTAGGARQRSGSGADHSGGNARGHRARQRRHGHRRLCAAGHARGRAGYRPSAQLRRIRSPPRRSNCRICWFFRPGPSCSRTHAAKPCRRRPLRCSGPPSRPKRSLWPASDARIQLVCETAAIRASTRLPAKMSGNCTAIARHARSLKTPHHAPGPRPVPWCAAAASAPASARSDRGDSRNAKERGSGWAGRRRKVNHANQ